MQKYRKKEYQGDNFRQAIKHNTLHYLKRMVFSGFLVTALLRSSGYFSYSVHCFYN